MVFYVVKADTPTTPTERFGPYASEAEAKAQAQKLAAAAKALPPTVRVVCDFG